NVPTIDDNLQSVQARDYASPRYGKYHTEIPMVWFGNRYGMGNAVWISHWYFPIKIYWYTKIQPYFPKIFWEIYYLIIIICLLTCYLNPIGFTSTISYVMRVKLHPEP